MWRARPPRVLALLLLAAKALPVLALSQNCSNFAASRPNLYTYNVVAEYPHDVVYTQGAQNAALPPLAAQRFAQP